MTSRDITDIIDALTSIAAEIGGLSDLRSDLQSLTDTMESIDKHLCELIDRAE